MKSPSLKFPVFLLAAVACAHGQQEGKIRTDVVFHVAVVAGTPA